MTHHCDFSRWLLKTATVLFISALLAGPSAAFDGRRRGIVVGGGIGFSPTAYTTLDGVSPESQNAIGFAAHARLAYHWNENSMLVLIYNAVFYKSDFAAHTGRTVSQGFEGLGWLQYFGDGPAKRYLIGGLGLQHFSGYSGDFESHDPGFGVYVAAGYEPVRHFQLEISFSLGKTSVSSVDFNHSQLMMTANVITF